MVNLLNPSDVEYITGLLTKFQALIAGTARKYGRPGDEEDIVSDACVHLLRHVPLLRRLEPRAQSSYIFKVVQHTAFKRNARNRYHLELSDQLPASGSLEALVERQLDMHSVLSRLKPQERDILLFYYIWGYSTREIAEIMNLKPGTAGVYLQRARDRAKRLFSEKEGQRHEE